MAQLVGSILLGAWMGWVVDSITLKDNRFIAWVMAIIMFVLLLWVTDPYTFFAVLGFGPGIAIHREGSFSNQVNHHQ